MRSVSLVILAALVNASCERSGTWVDDPANIKRAWGVELPREVTLRHSWYRRSAHFTREEAYYFQFAWHPELFEGFVAENRMAPLPQSKISSIEEYYCFDRPKWFAPGAAADYDVWVGPMHTNGVLLRHRASKELFIAACQL
jgi:hypothetical protein